MNGEAIATQALARRVSPLLRDDAGREELRVRLRYEVPLGVSDDGVVTAWRARRRNVVGGMPLDAVLDLAFRASAARAGARTAAHFRGLPVLMGDKFEEVDDG